MNANESMVKYLWDTVKSADLGKLMDYYGKDGATNLRYSLDGEFHSLPFCAVVYGEIDIVCFLLAHGETFTSAELKTRMVRDYLSYNRKNKSNTAAQRRILENLIADNNYILNI